MKTIAILARFGLLAVGSIVVVLAIGGLDDAAAQAKTRIAVTAFENKVKTPLPDSSWKIGEGLAEVDQAYEALALGEPDRRSSGLGTQDLGSTPVAGEPTRVRGQENDVGGAGGGVQVLLVGDRVPGEDAGADHQGRGPVELRRRLRARRLLEALERLRSHHPEAPWIGQVVIGRPARQLEQLVELLGRHRLRLEGLVGAPSPDRGFDLHAETVSGRQPDRLSRRYGSRRR